MKNSLIGNWRQLESKTAENVRLAAELMITQQLQQMLLPKPPELSQIHGLEIAGFMEPADEVGGDYYDVLHLNGRVKIGIGDVTGHGLESGMLMLMTQTAVRTLLEIQETNPVKFLNTLNRVIYDNARRMNCDKNLTLSLLDYCAGRVSISGQHEELIVVRSSGAIERIDTVNLGFPLGLEADITPFINETQIHISSGDVLVLYTDGVTEARNSQKQQYGVERLCRIVQQNRWRSADDIRQAVVDDVQHHLSGQKIWDDITLLVIKQK
ncbi:MAG: PP2C family protein-serine/threonine phosphatase [Leptolyngbyaceae cyanobacterium SL_7_1]|nr:PP2C family protein-serine/threonine phosphatase [Leptolyngbyaceae cyanobacterium SL_7_1]